MLKCSTSLWSADLGNLAAEMRRVEPHTEMWHLDVTDGQYVPVLLFFPDLVRQLRPHSALPFEVHLMTNDPELWIEQFAEVGADSLIVALDSTADPVATLRGIHARGKKAGVSLRIEEGIDLLDDLWEHLDVVTICGTKLGIKGAGMDDSVPGKIRAAKHEITRRGLDVSVQADGGIRRETVPLASAAGADYIVPGSLMFGEDPTEMRRWLATL